MQIVEFDRFGDPVEVLRCVEREDPVPGPGQIAVRMLRMPINPADLLLVEGRYGARQPTLPATPGAEGVGIVAALGEGASRFSVGDRVVPLVNGLWRSIVICRDDQAIAIPQTVDLDQAAMLKANPATAAALLDEAAAARPGDAVIQNAANSAVGRCLDHLARRRGVSVVNVVRRETAAAEIRKSDPAAAIVVHEDGGAASLQSQVSDAFPGLVIGFAIDALGGPATEALAGCVALGGLVVSYGRLSGLPCEVDPSHLIFRNVTVRGFWLPTWFRTAPRERVGALYGELIGLIDDGTLKTDVRAAYPLSRVAEAVAHAAKPARGGKIMLTCD